MADLIRLSDFRNGYISLVDYIKRNETSRNIVVVYCGDNDSHAEKNLEKFRSFMKTFKQAQIFPQLSVDFVVERELPFGPEVIRRYVDKEGMSLRHLTKEALLEILTLTLVVP